MSCFAPIRAWYGKTLPSGKRAIVFKSEASLTGVPFFLPCGRCIGCRLERARQWAVRVMHEDRMAGGGAFVTLTYKPEALPETGSLDKRELQLFMKRLRKRYGAGIRFFGCGEYGDNLGRPHYHLLLFNCPFHDKRLHKRTDVGNELYYSPELETLWPHGFNTIGRVTFESAVYVAGYITKQVNGKKREEGHYMRVSPDGVVYELQPEFVVMSRRPGLGTTWFDRFGTETYLHDSCIVNYRECKPPRYYDGKMEVQDPDLMVKLKRQRRAQIDLFENTPDRRRARERVVLGNRARIERDSPK